jgi:hypothetical protein
VDGLDVGYVPDHVDVEEPRRKVLEWWAGQESNL